METTSLSPYEARGIPPPKMKNSLKEVSKTISFHSNISLPIICTVPENFGNRLAGKRSVGQLGCGTVVLLLLTVDIPGNVGTIIVRTDETLSIFMPTQ